MWVRNVANGWMGFPLYLVIPFDEKRTLDAKSESISAQRHLPNNPTRKIISRDCNLRVQQSELGEGERATARPGCSAVKWIWGKGRKVRDG